MIELVYFGIVVVNPENNNVTIYADNTALLGTFEDCQPCNDEVH